MSPHSILVKDGAQPGATPRVDPTRSTLFVTSFEKGLRVLEAVGRVRHGLTLTEVAQGAGIDKSAAQRFTHTLNVLGYLDKDPITKRYSLGAKLLELGPQDKRSGDLIDRALPILRECNAAWGETTGLARLEGDEVVYLVRLPSRHATVSNITFGSRLPAWCTAAGRAILSCMPWKQARHLVESSRIEAYTGHTVTDTAALERMIAQAGREGFAISNQELFVGNISIAAPVFNDAGFAAAAVSITVPTRRWTLEKARRDLAPLILDLAQAVSISRPMGEAVPMRLPCSKPIFK